MKNQAELTRQEYESFKYRYSGLQFELQELEDREVKAFIARFVRLKADFEPLHTEALAQMRKAARWNAPAFNIFQILGVEHLEDNTHSPFLAELLNPQGTHGQGDLFLRAFLNQFHNDAFADLPLPETESEYSGWKIAREVHVGNGYLDIVIRNDHLGCLYIIENKIDAPEQPKQIRRYEHWLKRQTQYPKRALIFLTPTGRKPSTGNAFCLSYQDDIYYWLESVVDQIKASRVQSTIKQYMEIISRQKEEAMGYEDKVLEFIGQPENIKTALEVASYIEKLKNKKHSQFWTMFNAELNELYQNSSYRRIWSLSPMSKKEFNKSWAGCQLQLKSTLVSPDSPRLRFRFQQFPSGHKAGLYYGIRFDTVESPEEITAPELELLMERLRKQHIKDYPPNWLSWFTLGFPLLGDRFLVKMTNEADDFVNKLVIDFWEHFLAYAQDVETINEVLAAEIDLK